MEIPFKAAGADQPEPTPKPRPGPILLAGALGGLFLAIDILLPLGTADGVLFVGMVLSGWWMPGRKRPFIGLALAATLLTGLGYLLSPPADVPSWVVLVNRGYALLAIWSTAILLGIAKNALSALEAQSLDLSKFSLAVANSPASVIITDSKGRIEYVNPRFCELTGYQAAEVVGQKPSLLKSGRQADILYARLWQSITAGNIWRGHLLNRKKSGDLYWAAVSIGPVVDKRGRIRHYIGVQEDITQAREAERKLAHANRSLRTRYRFAEILSDTGEEKTILGQLCRVLVENAGYRLAWVGFAEPDGDNRVIPVAHCGFDEGYLNQLNLTWAEHTPRGQGPTGRAIRSGQPCVMRDLETTPEFAPWREEARRRGYASSVALPLKHQGRVFGTLNLYASHNDAFDGNEIELLVELADRMAEGIQRLREKELHQQTRNAMEASERRFRALFETMTSGVAIYEAIDDGADFIVKDMNQAGKRISACQDRNVIGMRATEAFPAIRQFGLFAVFQEVYHTGKAAFHPITYYQDAHHRGWLENIVYRLDTGEVVAVYDDLTEKRQAEEHLRLAQTSLENTSDMVFWVRPDGTFFRVNQSACDGLGYRPEELVSLTASDLNPAHPPAVWREHWAELREKGHLVFEALLKRKEAPPLPVEINANYLEFENQEFNLAIVRDIHVRKEAELALQASEQLLRDLYDNAPVPFLSLAAADGRILRANKAADALFGYQAE
ncbi:MAG: PAS domain S-box protein, partial [Magnetococcales bacterium]|nr:PAS domain S-box protein [Magnetococcales bacterium]